MSESGGKNRNLIPRFTFFGLLRWLWLRASRKEVIVEGFCLQCGVCCRGLNLSRKSHWIRSKAEFARLAAELPEYKRFIHNGNTLTGLMKFDCNCLSKEGYCADYEGRPDFCRAYPEADLYFMGGEIPPYCGFKFAVVPSFGNMLRREMKRATDDPPNTPVAE
ncbi:MAG: YkgJ family cysteine cluster protein [bacterium]